MTEPTKVVFDFTIFEDDGQTPLFGTASLGEITESDFQTPDPDLAHDRPYLHLPENFSGTRIDFLQGASGIGAVTVTVLDRRQDADDQTSGLVTSRIQDTKGQRALLRRWDELDEAWVKEFEGVLHTYSVDPENPLLYRFHLRDAREFERAQPLFSSNHVLFGEQFTHKSKTYSKHGPLIDYGTLPGGGVMINAVGPWESIVAGGITHFKRGDPMTWFGREIFWGLTPGTNDVSTFNLSDFWASTPADDGLFYFEDFWIRWRAKGSSDPWAELRDMPRAFPLYAVHAPNLDIPNYSDGEVSSFLYFTAPTLYFGSFDEDEIPTEGQEIEFQIMASRITPETPFWWDGGTVGDLLQEIAAGEHTAEIPQERYDAAALVAFALSSPPARFMLTHPVTDRRRWVEQNIYQPAMVAPGFTTDLEMEPVSWLPPDNEQTIPLIDPETIEPVGEWEDGTGNAISEVRYTYLREHLADQRTTTETKTKKAFGFIPYGKKTTEVLDVSQMEWERLIVDEVEVTRAAAETLPGAKPLTFAPVTMRTISDVYGRSQDVGDSRELSAVFQVARTMAEVFRLFGTGAPTYEAMLTATPQNRALRAGQVVRLHSEYLPDYGRAKRGTGRFVLIVSIAYVSPSHRRATFLDIGIPDPTFETDGEPGEDCLTGGVAYPAAEGKVVRLFSEDGALTNTCDHPVTVELIIIAGGGGGGSSVGGGGGGAGGVLGVTTPIEIELAPGASIPVTVGEGGGADASGDPSVFWMDPATGVALDPDVDSPPAEFHALGGGRGGASGSGNSGGSGGGSGKGHPISGGGLTGGSPGTSGQGSAGGGSSNEGGIATCQAAAGGGGGSFAGDGEPGSADTGLGSNPGAGGPAFSIDGWGLTAGGGGGGGFYDRNTGSPPEACAQGSAPGTSAEGGHGAGGAGGGGPSPAGLPGYAGCVAVRYAAALGGLQTPAISSTTTDDQSRATICIDAGDWAPGEVEGYVARVEYAVSPTEPAATSSLWKLAGYLSAPGCVTTSPLPTGAKVWARAVGEAPGYQPSAPSAPASEDLPETPGLLGLSMVLGDDGVPTLRWTPNAFADTLDLTGIQHAEGDDTTPPLAAIDSSVPAADLEYELPFTLAEGEYATVDVVVWDGATQGRSYRVSVQNPVRELMTREDGIDKLSDVEISGAAPDDVLQLDDYGVWVNRTLDVALAPYLHATRHQAGGADPIKLDDLDEPDDNTDLDTSAARHGLAPKLSGDADEFLSGDGIWRVPPGTSGDAWSEVIAGSDQDVTNNSTLQDDAELTFPVLTGEVYDFELLLLYSGSDGSVDFKWGLAFPSAEGFVQNVGARTTTDSVIAGQDRFGPAATSVAPSPFGTIAAHAATVAKLHGMIVVGGNGTFKFQFANNSAALGRVARRKAGSILRYRKLA